MIAAQVGTHADGRVTYGHSVIISPWGTVEVDLGEKEDQVTFDIDISQVTSVRTQIPSLKHERAYTLIEKSVEM